MKHALSSIQVPVHILDLSVAFFTCDVEYLKFMGPQVVLRLFTQQTIVCSVSSNFDLTLLVSLPKSVLMSPISCHHISVSASDAMIHSEQSGPSDNLFPYLSNYF